MCVHETINPLLDCDDCRVLPHKIYTKFCARFIENGGSIDELPPFRNFNKYYHIMQMEDAETIKEVFKMIKEEKETQENNIKVNKELIQELLQRQNRYESGEGLQKLNDELTLFLKFFKPTFSMERINKLKAFI